MKESIWKIHTKAFYIQQTSRHVLTKLILQARNVHMHTTLSEHWHGALPTHCMEALHAHFHCLVAFHIVILPPYE